MIRYSIADLIIKLPIFSSQRNELKYAWQVMQLERNLVLVIRWTEWRLRRSICHSATNSITSWIEYLH